MQSFFVDRAVRVIRESDLAVQVLLSDANDDLEFIPSHVPIAQGITTEEFTARNLRLVGVVGLCGLQSRCAFDEPLERHVIQAIAQAFMEYVRVKITPRLFDQVAQAEVMELERMFALTDPRAHFYA